MIVSEAVMAAPLQPSGKEKVTEVPPAAAEQPAGAALAPGTQGLQRLSSDGAAVVLTAQGAPAAPASPTAPAPAASAAPAPPGLDLHGQDLRAVDLTKLDLRGANLSGADLTGKDLTGIDLSGATLTGAIFDGATFSHANLHGVSAAGASFAKATFDKTDLDKSDFTAAKFAGATFGSNFQLAPTAVQSWGPCYIIKNVNLTKADFTGAEFKHYTDINDSTSDGAVFKGVRVTDTEPGGRMLNFLEGTAKGANFEGFGGGVYLAGVDATDADFSNINGGMVGFGLSKVDGATLHNSDTKLWLQNTDLRNFDFSTKNKSFKNSLICDCDISGMDFSGYDFSNTQFMSTAPVVNDFYGDKPSMKSSDLVAGTNFRGAKFGNAFFYNMQMGKALIDIRDLRGASVAGGLNNVVHIDNDHYDLGTLFPDFWARMKALLEENGITPYWEK